MAHAAQRAGPETGEYAVPLQLWPIPQRIKHGSDVYRLQTDFSTTINAPNANARRFLDEAVARYRHIILGQTPHLPQTPREGWNPRETIERLHIDIITANKALAVGETSLWPSARTEEMYTLSVGRASKNVALIQAYSVFGVLRALDTFTQLAVRSADDRSASDKTGIFLPHMPISIDDWPQFAHRGLMLDTARSFIPVDDLLRTLDAMSAVKMNVFHWHVVDSQSFPIKSEKLPELWKSGAYGPDMVYSAEDVRRIVDYGRKRGIRVIPEFDTPGHTFAWGLAYPELSVCANRQPNWQTFAAEPPSGQLDPTNPNTYALLGQLFAEQAKWFPDASFHMGGDEVNLHCYTDTPRINAYMQSRGLSPTELVRRYMNRVVDILANEGKTVTAWEESVLEYGLRPNSSIQVQVWKGAKNVADVVRLGYQVIASPADRWYLDCGRGEWINNAHGEKSWCDPYKDWRVVYTYDPLENLTLSRHPGSGPADHTVPLSHHPLVAGGEVALWSEQTDSANLDTQLWPRAAAAAEVLWSGRRDVVGHERTTREALPRLMALRRRLQARHIRVDPIQMLWCELNPQQCEQHE